MSLKVGNKYEKTGGDEFYNNLSDCVDNRLESSLSDFELKSQPDRKLFVGGLTSETSEKNLNDYFKTFGDVVSCAVKIFRDTGISRGFGFVVFKDEEAVKKVLSISEHKINGKKIDPKPAKCNKDTQKKVFVGGLDPEITAHQIEEHFNEFGKVEAVDLPYDNTKGRRKNYVFVVFSTEKEATKAASIERQEICGKICDVRVAVPRELSLRNRCQQSSVNWQQAILNLFYGQNQTSNFFLQNHLALSGSLNYWNLLNQRLAYPIRPDAQHLSRSAANVNFNNTLHAPTYGLEFPYSNGTTDKLPTSNFVPGNGQNFSSMVPVNPSISSNMPAESWGSTANVENKIQSRQQKMGSSGPYTAPASTQNVNGIPTMYGYPVHNTTNSSESAPYFPFTNGYQFPNGQSSLPSFYSSSVPSCYLATAPNGNIYQPILINPQPSNGDLSGNESSSPAFFVNPGYQSPFGNDFLTMLTPNQVNLPYIAYQSSPAADMLGLPYRQSAFNVFGQTPHPNLNPVYVSTFPFFNSMTPSDPVNARPLLYGSQTKAVPQSQYGDSFHRSAAPRLNGRSACSNSLGFQRSQTTFGRGQNLSHSRSRINELPCLKTDLGDGDCNKSVDFSTQSTSPDEAVHNNNNHELKPLDSDKVATDINSKVKQNFKCENSFSHRHKKQIGLLNGVDLIDLSLKSTVSVD